MMKEFAVELWRDVVGSILDLIDFIKAKKRGARRG